MTPAYPSRLPYAVGAFLTILIVIVTINTLITPERFFDFDTYLYITDGLYYFPESKWISFELGSTALLVGLRHLTGNTVAAVTAAHFLLGILCLGFIWLLMRWRLASWQAILLFFAMYGPMLAFVTIRATPAYLLIALAAFYANEGKRAAIVLAIIAFLFHVSVVLAVPALAVAFFQNRYKSFAWTDRAMGIAVAGAVLYLAIFILFRSSISGLISSVVGAVPFLTKYEIFTSGLDPTSVSQLASNSNFLKHYIYLAAASIFTAAFLLLARDERSRRFRSYLLISYFIFMFAQFSPVVAYRQSLYWMIPAIFLFPWRNFVSSAFTAVPFALICALLFGVNLGGVYS